MLNRLIMLRNSASLLMLIAAISIILPGCEVDKGARASSEATLSVHPVSAGNVWECVDVAVCARPRNSPGWLGKRIVAGVPLVRVQSDPRDCQHQAMGNTVCQKQSGG